MKKTILIVLLAAFMVAPAAKAQCGSQIYIDLPSIQLNFLVMSGGGVAEKAGATVWASKKIEPGPWDSLPAVNLPFDCTGWIYASNTDILTLPPNAHIRYKVFMIDNGVLFESSVAHWKMRKSASSNFTQRIEAGMRIMSLPSVKSMTIADAGINTSDLMIDDGINQIIDLGNGYELVRVTDEEADIPISSISQVKITSGLQTIWFDHVAEGLHFTYSVFDLSGRLITTGRNTDGSSHTLTILGLANGNYFVRIIDDLTGELKSQQVAIQY